MLAICIGLPIKQMNGQFANDSQFNYEVIGTVLGKGQIFTPDKYNAPFLPAFTHAYTAKKYYSLNNKYSINNQLNSRYSS